MVINLASRSIAFADGALSDVPTIDSVLPTNGNEEVAHFAD
jgi:hypothetical protein